MKADNDIPAVHTERVRRGFQVAAWLCPLLVVAGCLFEIAFGVPPPFLVWLSRAVICVLVLAAAFTLPPTSSYRRVLFYASALAVAGFLYVYVSVGATGGAASPYLTSYVLTAAASAFLLPLHPPAIFTIYPLSFAGYYLTLSATTPAGTAALVLDNALRDGVIGAGLAAFGAQLHYRTLADAFSWRSALRDEARRADLGMERARIARDLHDHIGARLTGIALRAEREQRRLPNDAHPTLIWIQETVRLCLEELRDTIWALSNSGREARELVATLRRRAEDIADAAGLELQWSIEDDSWNGRLSPGVSVALSAILREALTNTIRHSGAKQVTVTLLRRAEMIRMEISDDGCGLGEQPNEGRGLNNMKSRAKEQHGDVHVEQNGEHGLTVVAEIPWREDLFKGQRAA